MKHIITFIIVLLSAGLYSNSPGLKNTDNINLPEKVTISSHTLQDKIKGGWAGQTIGVTFGAPYEFKFNGTFIQDYQPLVWHKEYLKNTMVNTPGIYDDIYVDLTFVDVFHRLGLDAPLDSFANAFARTGYKLWHANQAARYNILNGIKAPESGHWMNNPHADDLDFQIESDFSGLMSPGMPNAAAAIGDKIGHIMNYGDGWYGGVYVGAMYSIAFVSDNVDFIVAEALKMIPNKSEFHQCIADVIKWHQQYPDDWHQTWFELQKKWSSDIGCPKGVFNAFNIDAKINAAYVTMGLLYGKGDYGKSLEIAARAGQDADCNPSTVGGVLGTMLGYDKIPSYWKAGLADIEDMDFEFTTMSLNDVYKIGYQHALEMIKRNGGSVNGDEITLSVQKPKTVRFEKSFEDLYPIAKPMIKLKIMDSASFSFRGTGFAILGQSQKKNKRVKHGIVKADLFIDGQKVESAKFPTNFTTRRFDLFWKYQLPDAEHKVKIVITNPNPDYNLLATEYVVYSNKPPQRIEK